MKKSIQSVVLLCLHLIAVSSNAQSNIHIDESLLIAENYVALSDNIVPVPDFAEPSESEVHTIKPVGIVAGSLLLSGGVVSGITGQILGKKVYSKYRGSAFTNNTDRLHKRVKQYNTIRAAGGICAGFGTFILIFSF